MNRGVIVPIEEGMQSHIALDREAYYIKMKTCFSFYMANKISQQLALYSE